MRSIEEEMPLLQKIMKMLSLTFGKDCEIVLHDWSKGYDHSIVAIENGYITGREIGDCGSNLGLEIMRGTIKDGDRFNYVTRTKTGKTLKSSTIFLNDDDGETLGAMCVNFDISKYLQFRDALNALIEPDYSPEDNHDSKHDEFFANNVNELTDYLLNMSLALVNKPVAQMTREDKMKIIDFLDQKGTFLITKSGDKVCQFLEMSKFTLYSYLDVVRAEKAEKNTK